MTPQIEIEQDDNYIRLQRCPYRQDLTIFCGETNCSKTDCPIWLKESGLLAQAEKETPGTTDPKPERSQLVKTKWLEYRACPLNVYSCVPSEQFCSECLREYYNKINLGKEVK